MFSELSELGLAVFEHFAAIIFLAAAIKAGLYAISLPRGPLRAVFSRLGSGAFFLAVMSLIWVVEDSWVYFDLINDALFIVGLSLLLWGYGSSLAFKLDVGGEDE